MTIADLAEHSAVTLVVTMGIKSKDLPTTIAQVNSDYILLEPILIDGRTVGFGSSCIVDLLYIQEQTVFGWRSVSLSLTKTKGKVYYKIPLSEEAQPYNRRNAFRVYIGEPMKIFVFQHTGPKPFDVLVRDISETGFGFISKEKYDVSRTIRFSIPLMGRKTLALAAKIVRREFDEEKQTYSYGCRFVEPNTALSSYLMQRQRERQQDKMSPHSPARDKR